MANFGDFKKLTKARLNTVKILMKANDWNSAAYMMGYALECSLKATVCKTLKLSVYPEYTKRENIDKYFMTHSFQQLLIVSGLSNIFSLDGPAKAFQNWSDFTNEYKDRWTEMRYEVEEKWDSDRVKKLYKYLVTGRSAIIKEIRKTWKIN